MSLSKGALLDALLARLQNSMRNPLRACLVTNERGLVVASLKNDPEEDERLAAMISLASDTIERITSNLEISPSDVVTMKGKKGTFLVCEFTVNGRKFRIGGITKEGPFTKLRPSRWSIFRKEKEDDEAIFKKASLEAKAILEG